MVKIKAARGKRPPSAKRRRGPRDDATRHWLYGHHAVAAALKNPARQITRLLATPQAAERLHAECPDTKPETAERGTIESLVPEGAVHQGIALQASPLPATALEDAAASVSGSGLLLVLDQVTDPQNVGAILRSAAAFGAKALIMPQRHAPPVTGALAKAASGALEHVPLVTVTNLDRGLKTLKQADFWILGLDADADTSIAETTIDGKLVLVLGAEGAGLRRLTAERCDLLLRLPMTGPIPSLNVSAAAAVALYALSIRLNS
jgi:23S rRNA (guanosine2251-2'-O)-methyltransferase